MALVLTATPGSPSANTYETLAEAQAYFDARLPLSGWDDGPDQNIQLAMATRVLDAMAQPRRVLVPAQGGVIAYYRTMRQWTGLPATATQRLAWPRVGMYDQNGNALDVAIASTSATNPVIVTTATPHLLVTGMTAFIFGVAGSSPDVNGARVVTVIDDTSFSVVLDASAGTGGVDGRVTTIPQALKDAESELAGQLWLGDRTLDNDVAVQGVTSVRAGSVALTFKDNITPQVIPDAVFNLMPRSWLTDELFSPALQAELDVISERPHGHGRRW